MHGEPILERALRALGAFTEAGEGLTLRVLAARAGLPKSTASRIATQLTDVGALERLDTGGFVAGRPLLEIASLAPRGHGLRAAALRFMEDLHRVTGPHVLLAVREGDETFLVERLSARDAAAVKYRGGGRRPLAGTGIGVALRPDAVLAQHVLPHPAGYVGTRPGSFLSAADSLRVTVHGRGAHASAPQTSVDPVVIAATIVVRLQTIVSRELAATTPAVVTVGSIRADGGGGQPRHTTSRQRCGDDGCAAGGAYGVSCCALSPGAVVAGGCWVSGTELCGSVSPVDGAVVCGRGCAVAESAAEAAGSVPPSRVGAICGLPVFLVPRRRRLTRATAGLAAFTQGIEQPATLTGLSQGCARPV